MRRVVFLILVTAACVVPLIFGVEEILLFELAGGLPLGTLLAAVALMAASLIPIVLSRPGSVTRGIAVLASAASVLWLPIGIWLSGNAALNFSNDAVDSSIFWRYTIGMVALILTLLIWTPVASRVTRRSD
ncbi:MAG: hypothetical protein ACPGJE_00480 [Wenzhouxiangellaceae bacterium]